MAKYSLLTQTHYDINIGHYTSYGITAKEKENTITVADISTQQFAVEQLIEKFNKMNLSLSHIYDVIEDYLYDLELD